jgi:hypothetical protein
MTRIEDLRHRVTLLKRRIMEEADGSFKEIWQEGDSVWAQVLACQDVARGLTKGAFGEGWNNLTPVRMTYKVTMRFHPGRFERIRLSFKEEETLTLALLSPPVMNPHRQWMMCLMYILGKDDE